MFWDGSIFDAKESEDEELEEGKDGNYTYNKSGTYGQSDFTVRERKDGTYDVYTKSDSDKNHSHDHIDKDGNLLDSYHDELVSRLLKITREEISNISYSTTEECIDDIYSMLEQKPKCRKLTK